MTEMRWACPPNKTEVLKRKVSEAGDILPVFKGMADV